MAIGNKIATAAARELVKGAIDGIAKPDDPLRKVKLGIFALVLVIGWVFVLMTNKFHLTAPVVFVCLGYLAVVATVMNLWRTGAAVVAPTDANDQWGRPIGERGELEKEKRTLLKAIKEAEFDHAMGKLSKADSDSLIRGYRARAIEVIKALDRLEAGAALSPKEQIAREVKARLDLAASDKPSHRAKNAAEKKAAQAADKAAKAEEKAAKAEEKAAKADDGVAAKADATSEAKDDTTKADDTAKADAETAPANVTEPKPEPTSDHANS